MLTREILHDIVVDYWFHKLSEIDDLPISDIITRREAYSRLNHRVVATHRTIDVLFKCPIFKGRERLNVLKSLGIF